MSYTDEEKQVLLEKIKESVEPPKEADFITGGVTFPITTPIGTPGWVCPVCGGGNAPHVSRCPCSTLPIPQVTC